MRIGMLCSVLVFGFLPVGQSAEVVMMIGEDEYRTWETLPEFSKTELEPKGHHVTIVHADAMDKNRFPGLEAALSKADVLWVSVRRRTLPKAQMAAVREFVGEGKPLVGIRTASHAFALRKKESLKDDTLAVWPEFDAEVLGGNYQDHHRDQGKTVLSVAPGGVGHSILMGVQLGQLLGNGTLYRNEPLKSSARALLIGSIPGQPPEPVAWTHEAGQKRARVFYTSLGHPDDFKEASFRLLLLNAMDWALGK